MMKVLKKFFVVLLFIGCFCLKNKDITVYAYDYEITLPEVKDVVLNDATPYFGGNIDLEVGDTITFKVPIPSYSSYYSLGKKYSYRENCVMGTEYLGSYFDFEAKKAGIFDLYWSIKLTAKKAMGEAFLETDIKYGSYGGCYSKNYLYFVEGADDPSSANPFVKYGLYVKEKPKKDETAPKVTGIKNNKEYKSAVTIKFSDVSGVSSAKLNGKSIKTNKKVTKDGRYTFVVKDMYGNSRTIKFVIDKKIPKITGVKNNKTYKKGVTIKFSDSLSGIQKAKLNNKNIKSGKKVTKNGNYVLVVTDKAGNKNTIKFRIKK